MINDILLCMPTVLLLGDLFSLVCTVYIIIYIHFCVKRFELSHVMDIALYNSYLLLLLLIV